MTWYSVPLPRIRKLAFICPECGHTHYKWYPQREPYRCKRHDSRFAFPRTVRYNKNTRKKYRHLAFLKEVSAGKISFVVGGGGS